ncbi:hypothetical protein [Caldilinea sp.]|uniref:ferric reductase-like transmembrane domain-containing protein n=1 Tax=Caldilinea sp. TaxID=2293560 RepID=UPI002C98DEC0|nr:ferric reductase-like transmembrane domain-containing protein [Caldilinea sp.]HRA67826.1 ferric reductase-like transmembrane domain-containing protein [Caldilinea sp.]
MDTSTVRRPPDRLRCILIYGAFSTTLLLALYAGSLMLEANGLKLSDESIWYAIRASGVVSYLLLAASAVWGILLSGRLVKVRVSPALALELHTYLSWTAIGMTIYHAYLLLFSSFFDYRVVDLLIPFLGPYEPLAVGLGVIGIYLMLLTSISFYGVQRIGYKTFRRLHYLTYVAFGLATVHSWLAGTDTPLLYPVYLAVSIGIFLLTLARLFVVRQR